MTQGKYGKGLKPLSWQTCLEAGVTQKKCSQETERQKHVLKLHSVRIISKPIIFLGYKCWRWGEHYKSISTYQTLSHGRLYLALNKTETYNIKKGFKRHTYFTFATCSSNRQTYVPSKYQNVSPSKSIFCSKIQLCAQNPDTLTYFALSKYNSLWISEIFTLCLHSLHPDKTLTKCRISC